jgi:hypothetical protein
VSGVAVARKNELQSAEPDLVATAEALTARRQLFALQTIMVVVTAEADDAKAIRESAYFISIR